MAVIISFDQARLSAKLAPENSIPQAWPGDVDARSQLGKEAGYTWWLVSELAKARAAGDSEELRDTIDALEIRVRLTAYPAISRLAQRALQAAQVVAMESKAKQQRSKRRARRRA